MNCLIDWLIRLSLAVRPIKKGDTEGPKYGLNVTYYKRGINTDKHVISPSMHGTLTCYSEELEWYLRLSGRLLHLLTIFNPRTKMFDFLELQRWSMQQKEPDGCLKRNTPSTSCSRSHTKKWHTVFHELELQRLRSKVSPTNSVPCHNSASFIYCTASLISNGLIRPS